MDTNILPVDDKTPLELKSRDKFSVPGFTHSPKKATDLECWMYYSPTTQESKTTAQTILNDFYHNWIDCERVRGVIIKQRGSLEPYHERLGVAIMDPVLQAYKTGKVGLIQAEYKVGFADINELGLRKTYYNTHTFVNSQKDITNPEVFYSVFSGNTVALDSLISAHVDLNTTALIDFPPNIYKGETPLHVAIRTGQRPEIIEKLLEGKANPNTPAAELNYNHTIVDRSPRVYTNESPLLIATRTNQPAIVELLLRHGADTEKTYTYTIKGEIKTVTSEELAKRKDLTECMEKFQNHAQRLTPKMR